MHANTKLIIFSAVAVLTAGLFMIGRLDTPHPLTTSPVSPVLDRPTATPEIVVPQETFRSERIGLLFSYKTGPGGYVLETLSTTDPDVVQRVILTPASDYAELKVSTGPREGPPTIGVTVYPNEQSEQPRMWANSHPQASNFNLIKGDVLDTAVGGANAIRYTVDGLYRVDAIVVAHGSFMYIITGSYLEEGSPTRIDFDPFLNTIVFIPTIHSP